MSRRAGGNQIIPRPETWRLGATTPWENRDLSVLSDFDEVTARLTRVLAVYEPEIYDEYINATDAKPSAVLVALLPHESDVHVLLTRRAQHLNNHKGEVSFPGGRLEHGETHQQAALREAHEEVSLAPSAVTVVGSLDTISTFVSKSIISPIVGFIPPSLTLVPDLGEVARIFTVSLQDLVRPDTYRNEWWLTPRGEINIHFFELDDETVWGATGRMLTQLLDIITREK